MSGKKTYLAAIGMILAAIAPAFTEGGINPGLIDQGMLGTGIVAIFLRQGVAKAENKP